MFRSISKRSSNTLFKGAQRGFHEVPKLKNQDLYLQRGIEGLYTPKGFKSAWLDYQKYLTLNLSLHTSGTESELKTPYQILLYTAKMTTEQHIFHYASQAHNNHFVFEQFADKSEASKTQPSKLLLEKLADIDFPTIEAFRDEFLLIADSSFGQGWVFLVESADKSLRIVKCNNDGTPYYYGKNQSLDFNGSADEASYEYLNGLKELAAQDQKDFSLPILGINLWDTAFIEDYGATGKAEYLENAWKSINWNVVNKRLFQI
ncbi:manganese and iron superoxide dismutase [Hyphopichia burtonii NRRL Y-1933]|uniref:Manganese and iron superoxide dismutase n=1 Tax=Hyphopichia burtonii NRRL Y-1933 TaxID=984485 RepID=A0A1E4RJG4_9ASCO|nr:manganese and iron superoxide dismutase [Hyphopichia burtonii NRRL Y-1933]ODV67376.1 manganese and iron superoxide dismutase [Hyphopichia burtonii NRRL Y-1933]